MPKRTPLCALAAMDLFAGCTQTGGNVPTPNLSGPVDPAARAVFTLSSMTRPITKALFETDGGIHDELKRIRPDVYSDNFQVGFVEMKIEADFSSSPKRLFVQTYDGTCKWAAAAP